MNAIPQKPKARLFAGLGILLVFGSLAAGILVRGDGGGSSAQDSSGGQSSGGGAAESTDAVTIKNFKYMPEQIEVKAGTKVTFTNDDTAAHTATADSFDTGSIAKGQKQTVTPKQAGTISYICDFHPYMKGSVVVK